MTRRILFGFALAAAALVPVPAADAGQMCVKATVTGIVNQSAGTPCISVGPQTPCREFFTSVPPSSTLDVDVCAPTPLPPDGEGGGY